MAQSASTPMATMAPSAKACRVLDLSTYTHNTPRPPVRAERAISCVLRGSVWLADEKVRLAGGDKRGLITLLFVARPPQNSRTYRKQASKHSKQSTITTTAMSSMTSRMRDGGPHELYVAQSLERKAKERVTARGFEQSPGETRMDKAIRAASRATQVAALLLLMKVQPMHVARVGMADPSNRLPGP